MIDERPAKPLANGPVVPGSASLIRLLCGITNRTEKGYEVGVLAAGFSFQRQSIGTSQRTKRLSYNVIRLASRPFQILARLHARAPVPSALKVISTET